MSDRKKFLEEVRQSNKELEEFTNIFIEWGSSISDKPIEKIKQEEREYVRNRCSDEFNEMIDGVFKKYNKTTDRVTSQDEER